VRCAHYGALRGLNHFKDVAAAVIVGRPALSNDELELLTEAIFAADATQTTVAHATNWGTLDGAVPLADGSIVTVRHDGHPDYLCRSVQSLISQADVVQGMARVRPYSRTPGNPCEIVYFGQLPCGLPVERICATQDVRPHEAAVACALGGLSSDAALNRTWHAHLFAAANSRVALDTRQSPRWFMQQALMAWWKRRSAGQAQGLIGAIPAELNTQLNTLQCAAYPYIEIPEQAGDGSDQKKLSTRDKLHIDQCSVNHVHTHVNAQVNAEPEFRFWLLSVVGNHHHQRMSRQGGPRGAYARKVLVLARASLQPVTIAQQMGVALKDARELTDAQIETECARMLRGIIEHTVAELPALAGLAVGCDPLEFVETWVGWGGLFAR
jgi:hypothetical protein